VKVVLPDTVVVKPSGPKCVPVGFEPVAVAYVPNTPISNSLGLKNDSGAGGGGGVITAFEGTSGPANATIACDSAPITVKTIDFFICRIPFSTQLYLIMYYLGSFFWASMADPTDPVASLLLDLGPIRRSALANGRSAVGCNRRPSSVLLARASPKRGSGLSVVN
jgi:hypothetical protein